MSAPVTLAEVKAALRLDRDDEDALLAGHIRAASALCEAFVGSWLFERGGSETLRRDLVWQRLTTAPVTAISGVSADGGALAAGAFETDIDAGGQGWVRLVGLPAQSASVSFRAGIAPDWKGLPEGLRAGIVRLVTHLYTHRDAADAGPPPAAVAALWRPWRRMRLG